MLTNWERKIRHIDRKVRPAAIGRSGLRGRMLKAKVKQRRGLPSRNVPLDLVLERLRIEFADKTDGMDTVERLHRLDGRKMHERLMERKRRQRDAARRKARPRVADTRIYLWRTRQEWLRRIEGAEEDAVENGRLANPPG
jgi:hypothetical protein